VAQQPNSVLGPSLSRFLDHTQLDTHTHSVGLLRTINHLTSKPTTYTAGNEHKRRTPIHSAGFDPSNQAAADLCLRPHSYRDRPYLTMTWVQYSLDRISISKYVCPIIRRSYTDKLHRGSNPGMSNSLVALYRSRHLGSNAQN